MSDLNMLNIVDVQDILQQVRIEYAESVWSLHCCQKNVDHFSSILKLSLNRKLFDQTILVQTVKENLPKELDLRKADACDRLHKGVTSLSRILYFVATIVSRNHSS